MKSACGLPSKKANNSKFVQEDIRLPVALGSWHVDCVRIVPVHNCVPVMGNAVCPLAQVPAHGKTNFKPRKGKALEHNHIAICI